MYKRKLQSQLMYHQIVFYFVTSESVFMNLHDMSLLCDMHSLDLSLLEV